MTRKQTRAALYEAARNILRSQIRQQTGTMPQGWQFWGVTRTRAWVVLSRKAAASMSGTSVTIPDMERALALLNSFHSMTVEQCAEVKA